MKEAVEELVARHCSLTDFNRLPIAPRRTFQHLALFHYVTMKDATRGINALLDADRVARASPLGVGWFQVSKSRTAIVHELIGQVSALSPMAQHQMVLITAAENAMMRILWTELKVPPNWLDFPHFIRDQT